MKTAIESRSAAVLLVHNHPSAAPEFSQADELITRRIKECLATVDVRVLDHILVAGEAAVSMAELGLL